MHAQSDAKFCVQIGHAWAKGSTRLVWDGMDKPRATGNWPLIAPSAIPIYPFSQTSAEMRAADMVAVTSDFVSAAGIADDAGADLLEGFVA